MRVVRALTASRAQKGSKRTDEQLKSTLGVLKRAIEGKLAQYQENKAKRFGFKVPPDLSVMSQKFMLELINAEEFYL